jgi:hypothetical protein
MSVSEAISNRVKHMQKGRPFAGAIFAETGPRGAVDKALSRMVKGGALERVTRGVYMRPKASKVLGRVRANPVTVMEVITRAKGEIIQIHGAEAVRRFGLSTQMQILPTYYTSGSSREIKVGNGVVRLRHVSRNRLQHAGSKVGIALTALHYLGREEATESVVSKIVKSLSHEEFQKLRICLMPEWMRSALSQAAKDLECQSHTST